MDKEFGKHSGVYSDLESVGKQDVLDHAPTIKGFVTKLPGKAIVERYIATNKELKAKGDSDLAIVKAFMKSERQNQKQLMELLGSKGSSKDPVVKGRCFKCNQSGHRQAECPNESSEGALRNHVTVGKYCNSAHKVSNHGQRVPRLLGRGEPGAPTSMDIGAVDTAHSLFQLQKIPFENKFVNRVSTFFDSGSKLIW